MEPSKLTKEHSAWSPSKTGTAEHCAYRFNCTYINKPEGYKYRNNSDALVGIAIHKVLEMSLMGKQPAVAMRMVVAGNPEDPESPYTAEESDRIYDMLPNVDDFISKMRRYTTKHPCFPPLLERKFGVTTEGKNCRFFGDDVFMRGVVDYALLFKDNTTALILDHKSGAATEDISKFELQFDTYKLLLKAKYPKLRRIKVGINFIRDGEIVMEKDNCNVVDIVPLRNKVIEAVNKASVNLVDLNVTNKGPLCKWCNYQFMCPALVKTNGKTKEGDTKG